jgi:hypothetical protein
MASKNSLIARLNYSETNRRGEISANQPQITKNKKGNKTNLFRAQLVYFNPL